MQNSLPIIIISGLSTPYKFLKSGTKSRTQNIEIRGGNMYSKILYIKQKTVFLKKLNVFLDEKASTDGVEFSKLKKAKLFMYIYILSMSTA